MNKTIVVHDLYSGEPIVISVNSIAAARQIYDTDGDKNEKVKHSDILISYIWIQVIEDIGTVMNKINKVKNAGGEEV